MTDTTLTIRADTPIGTISPRLYGHFAEHLGRCCYGGLWVGNQRTDIEQQGYYDLLAEAHATEAFVVRTAAIIADATGGKRRIGIALDEWGVWHPEARPWGPHGELSRDPVTYEQANTLRDALAAGIALEGFHRQCNVLTLANLAQIVNVLQAVVMTDGPRMWLTPTYHALWLHAPHIGATALPVTIAQGESLPDGSSAVSATASRTDEGLAVTLINRHYRQEATVRIACADAPGDASGQLLTADSPRASNSLDQPGAVAPVALTVSGDGPARWHIDLPPHSLATVVIRSW